MNALNEQFSNKNSRFLSILLSAYACEPDKGSEPGIGWKWARNLANVGHRVHVITRANNKESIDAALRIHPMPGVEFSYYDLPDWAKRWKKGGRGVHLYYLLWQWGAYGVAKKLSKQKQFDIVHHITFGVFRQPSFMAFLGVPFVFGPLGGGESAPYALRKSFSFKGKVVDFLRDVANKVVYIDPIMSAVYKRSSIILCKTRETLRSIPSRYQDKCQLQLEIGTEQKPPEANNAIVRKGIRVLYVGRLVYLKGMHLGLPAFAQFLKSNRDARLTIVGSGPEQESLKALATHLSIDHAIDWIPWLKQHEVMQVYPKHDIFLFPSLHDSSGNAVLEALSFGVPVVCLNLGGPGVLVNDDCGIRVLEKNEKAVIDKLANALRALATNHELRDRLSKGALIRAHEDLSWSTQTEKMCELYEILTNNQTSVPALEGVRL